MTRGSLKRIRYRRTWPKFVGASFVAAAVVIADGYLALVPAAVYLLAAALFLPGLPKRYALAAAGVSFFAAAAFFFGYLKTGEPAPAFIVVAKVLALAWVSAYLYVITPPTALVSMFSRAFRPLRLLGVRTYFWAASLGFAVGAVPAARRTASEAVTAARLRGASAAKTGTRIKLAGLVMANVFASAVSGGAARADAYALRGGTADTTLRRREGPVGLVTFLVPVAVFISTIVVETPWR